MHGLRTLVTGGAGFIGSHLVDRLMKEGYEVVVLDNFSAGKTENIQRHLRSQSFRLVKGDVRNLEDVRKAVGDIDVVFHLAAIVNVPLSIEDPLLVNDVNIEGTLNLLEASLKENIQRFIYISTCAVYGEARYLPINEEHPIMPLSPYGISKFTAEHYCKIFHHIHGLKTASLRLFNVYGPRQSEGPYSGVITRFISRLRRGKPPIIYGDGEQTRDFMYIDNVVELNNVLTKFFGQARVKPVYTAPREGDIRNSYADTCKAEKMLGYKPRITLKEGIKMLLKKPKC
jgi:nucleoside-diphosphate-sugar epimerase